MQKFALATSKTVLQVVRIQSLVDYGKIPFFQNASSVKLQQKGTKKQPNVRLFGEFHFHLFRSHCLKSHVFRATSRCDSADFVLHAFDRPHFSRSGRFALSSLFLVLRIGLFNLGADVATSPMGEQIGSGLTKSRKLSVLLFRVFFCMLRIVGLTLRRLGVYNT